MPTSKATSEQQTIEQLQQRYNDLNKRKIQAETQLEGAKKQLDALKHQALQEYGTDDIVQLREKLQAMKEQNEKQRSDYQAALEQMDAALLKVESDFAAAQRPEAKGA